MLAVIKRRKKTSSIIIVLLMTHQNLILRIFQVKAWNSNGWFCTRLFPSHRIALQTSNSKYMHFMQQTHSTHPIWYYITLAYRIRWCLNSCRTLYTLHFHIAYSRYDGGYGIHITHAQVARDSNQISFTLESFCTNPKLNNMYLFQ